jgi:hypothetical protein
VVAIIAVLLVLGGSGVAILLIHNRPHGKSTVADETPGLRLMTISASQSSPKYSVKVSYPQLVSTQRNPALTRIDVELANAAQGVVVSFENSMYQYQVPSFYANETSTLDGTVATNLLDRQFASFSLDIGQFNAGAVHPFATVTTFNFDEATGKPVQLADLFQPGSDWLSVLSEESRSLLPAVIGQNSLPDEFGSGTGPSASNFKAWALTPWGLSIAFQEYQVGPYADGQPTILIPFSALQSVALARGPLASIEASRPLRSPLLPAVVPPAVNECMAPTSWGPAGPTPLRCASGALNVSAWNEWNIGGNYSVTGLGRSAALKTVEKAMCADVKFDPSYSAPFEIRLATLSALYYGWRFAANPASNFPRYCTTIASKTSSSKTSSTTTTTSNAFADVVPVVECPSVYGIAATPASKYPSTIAVSLPASVAEQLSYYSDSTRSVLPILAPRGWDCSVGVGADGQVGIGVFPQSPPASFPSSFEHSSVQGVIAHSDSACQGCISETACPLVPSAVEGTFSTYSPCPYSRPPNEEVRWALGSPSTPLGLYTYDVVYFTDPPGVAGDGAPSGGPLTARGVLLFSNGPDTYPAASIETCTLPSNLAGLCTPILNDFSNREWYVSG